MADLKDHRDIGREMDLFSFHEYAPGAVFWHPKGWTIYQQIMKLLRDMLAKSGYQEIKTPVMVKNDLFKKSGHWKHFGTTNMFNLEDEKQGYTLKPMNCPESTIVFNSSPRSYRDLPLKLSEFGILHRRELTGVLGGLFRLREFTIDDAHIYCRQDQIQEVVHELLEDVQNFYKVFKFDLRFYLATKPDKALDIPGMPNLWPDAEVDLEKALKKSGLKFDIKEKDGAFYGPKIDFHMTDSQGRDWQLATVQIDFQIPRALNTTYTNEKGEKEYSVIIHRAYTGSIERFMGILLEQYQGSLPVWLSPVQVAVLPVSDKYLDQGEKIYQLLTASGIRTQINRENKTLGLKIRECALQKIPFVCIIGQNEIQISKSKVQKKQVLYVSVRTREGKDEGMIKLEDFIIRLKSKIDTKL